MLKYITAEGRVENWGVLKRRVQILYVNERVKGDIKHGGGWQF